MDEFYEEDEDGAGVWARFEATDNGYTVPPGTYAIATTMDIGDFTITGCQTTGDS